MNADRGQSGFKRPPDDPMAPPAPLTLEPADLDFGILHRLVRRRLAAILALTLLLTALCLPLILTLRHSYSAYAQMLITPPAARDLVTQPEEARRLDLGQEVDRVVTHDSIEEVIRRLKLDTLPEFNPRLQPPGLVDRLKALLGPPPEAPTAAANALQVHARVASSVSVYRLGTSSVVQVVFVSRDPDLAAAAVNAFVDIYRARRNAMSQRDLLAARDWLTRLRAQQAERLGTAWDELQAFRSTHGIASGQGQSEPSLRLAALTIQQSDLARRRAIVQEALAAVEDPALDFEGSKDKQMPLVSQLRVELAAKEGELAKLRQTYGESYGAVATLVAQVEGLRDRIAAQVTASEAQLKARLTLIDDEAARVAQRIDTVRETITQDSLAAADLVNMVARADGMAAALRDLDKQIDALGTELTFDAVDIEILTPATRPLGPNTRGKKYYLAVALVASAAVSLAAVALRDLFDKRIRSLAELNLPTETLDAGLLPLLPRHRIARLAEIVPGDPGSFFADAVRNLLATLELETGGQPLRSLLVTSAREGEGKTTVATALALALRARNRRVVLVSCDAGDKPRGATAAGAAASRPQPCLEDRIRRDAATGIEHLRRDRPGSGFFPGPVDLANLAALAATGNVTVIFDAPAVLSGTAARLPPGLSDSCLVVARWGRTSGTLVRLAFERLQPGQGTTMFAVLNAVDYRRQAFYGVPDAPAFRELARASRT